MLEICKNYENDTQDTKLLFLKDKPKAMMIINLKTCLKLMVMVACF